MPKKELRTKLRETPVKVSVDEPVDKLVRVEIWHDEDGKGWATLHWDIPQADGSWHRYTEDVSQDDFPAADVQAITDLLDKLVA